MNFEVIDVDDTSIIIVENKEPIFLNETATVIIKEYLKGTEEDTILKKIQELYDICEINIEEIKNQISKILKEFKYQINLK